MARGITVLALVLFVAHIAIAQGHTPDADEDKMRLAELPVPPALPASPPALNYTGQPVATAAPKDISSLGITVTLYNYADGVCNNDNVIQRTAVAADVACFFSSQAAPAFSALVKCNARDSGADWSAQVFGSNDCSGEPEATTSANADQRCGSFAYRSANYGLDINCAAATVSGTESKYEIAYTPKPTQAPASTTTATTTASNSDNNTPTSSLPTPSVPATNEKAPLSPDNANQKVPVSGSDNNLSGEERAERLFQRRLEQLRRIREKQNNEGESEREDRQKRQEARDEELSKDQENSAVRAERSVKREADAKRREIDSRKRIATIISKLARINATIANTAVSLANVRAERNATSKVIAQQHQVALDQLVQLKKTWLNLENMRLHLMQASVLNSKAHADNILRIRAAGNFSVAERDTLRQLRYDVRKAAHHLIQLNRVSGSLMAALINATEGVVIPTSKQINSYSKRLSKMEDSTRRTEHSLRVYNRNAASLQFHLQRNKDLLITYSNTAANIRRMIDAVRRAVAETRVRVRQLEEQNRAFEASQKELEKAACRPACLNGNCTRGACVCTAGWTGVNCGLPVAPVCAPTCSQFGTCVLEHKCDVMGGCVGNRCKAHCRIASKCQCKNGYSGLDCSVPPVFKCDPPCLNGNCTADGVCTCREGWAGWTCGLPTAPDCQPTCSEFGQCVVKDECVPVAGCVGPNCPSICTPKTQCECSNGFTGAACEVPPVFKCEPGCVKGKCVAPNVCACEKGFTGVNCAMPIEPVCAQNCSAFGSCVLKNKCTPISGCVGNKCPSLCTATTSCKCRGGYTGASCEVPPPIVCNPGCINGQCVANNTCACNAGWAGSTCGLPLSPSCAPHCSEFGKCVLRKVCKSRDSCVGQGCQSSCKVVSQCLCRDGFTGPDCSVAPFAQCSPKCFFGECISDNTCRCRPGWTGALCDTPVCEPPCSANGRCTAPNTCTCSGNFTGVTCAVPTQPVCSPRCTENGECKAVTKCFTSNGCVGINCPATCVASSKCECARGFRGPTCAVPVCQNQCVRGRCTAPNNCTCEPGWTGAVCDRPVCQPGCGARGKCIGPNLCMCESGYTGPVCRERISTNVTVDVIVTKRGDDVFSAPVVKVNTNANCDPRKGGVLGPECKFKTEAKTNIIEYQAAVPNEPASALASANPTIISSTTVPLPNDIPVDSLDAYLPKTNGVIQSLPSKSDIPFDSADAYAPPKPTATSAPQTPKTTTSGETDAVVFDSPDGYLPAGADDCLVTAWSEWSECKDGSRTRTRTVFRPNKEKGRPCPSLSDVAPCPHVQTTRTVSRKPSLTQEVKMVPKPADRPVTTVNGSVISQSVPSMENVNVYTNGARWEDVAGVVPASSTSSSASASSSAQGASTSNSNNAGANAAVAAAIATGDGQKWGGAAAPEFAPPATTATATARASFVEVDNGTVAPAATDAPRMVSPVIDTGCCGDMASSPFRTGPNTITQPCPQVGQCCVRNDNVFVSGVVDSGLVPHNSMPSCQANTNLVPTVAQVVYDLPPSANASSLDALLPQADKNWVDVFHPKPAAPACPVQGRCCFQNNTVYFKGRVIVGALPHHSMSTCARSSWAPTSAAPVVAESKNSCNASSPACALPRPPCCAAVKVADCRVCARTADTEATLGRLQSLAQARAGDSKRLVNLRFKLSYILSQFEKDKQNGLTLLSKEQWNHALRLARKLGFTSFVELMEEEHSPDVIYVDDE